MWEFKKYTVYKETDLLRFEDLEGNVLGYVAFNDGGEELTNELDNGADPIAEGWEDGVGNVISLEGWGNQA